MMGASLSGVELNVRRQSGPRAYLRLPFRFQLHVNIPRQSRGLYGVSRSKRLLRSLLMPTSLLGLAHTNDCAQHSHPSAAIRAIFIASIICVTVQHSKTENRDILPEMSNFYCHPGRAGGFPIWFRIAWMTRSGSSSDTGPRGLTVSAFRPF
jgi:hypothetical protein